MTIYHGSLHKIEHPQFGAGNPKTDYGPGFYCTQNIELAKEWGCSEEQNGFANEYTLNPDGLSVLDLNQNYTILNWLAILLENRTFNLRRDISIEGKKYILQNFLPEYKSYDIIKGYRADDSYFSFATAFLENTISVQKLNMAMKLGRLGEQIVLKSEKSFAHIQFVQCHTSEKEIWFPKKSERDSKARSDFFAMRSEDFGGLHEEIYLLDLIRQEVAADDARLQRALSL